MINQLQKELFTCHISRDLIIFLAHYAYSRKNRRESIIYYDIIMI